MIPAMYDAAKQKLVGMKQALDGRKKKKQSYVATAEEKYFLSKLDEPRRVRTQTLEAFEPIWTRSILYTAGVQHLHYLHQTRQFKPRPHEDWMPMPVINVIQPKVERVVDFFTRNRPSAYVVPKSKEEDDRHAAKHGEHVLANLWDLNNDDEKYNEASHWNVVTGNVLKRHLMDSTIQALQSTPEYQFLDEPLMDERGPVINTMTGQPVMTRRVAEGPAVHPDQRQGGSPTVSSEIYGPLHYTVPLATSRFDEAPWNLFAGLYPLNKLRQLHPDKADFIPEHGNTIVSDLYHHRILSLLTSGVGGVVRSLDPYLMKGYGTLFIYEEAPSPELPNGLVMTVLDDIPLTIDELPMKTRYSTEHCGYYYVPGRFWRRGMVEDLIHIQDQINKLEQILQLNDAFNTNPMILVPEQANIPQGQLSNKPGLVVRYNYPFKPEFQEGVSMPAQIVQRRAIYMEDAEEISGVRNVLMGNAPGGVKSGVALNRLGEEAEGIFSPIAKMWERFIERCSTSQLELVQRYYNIPQHITIQGGSEGDIDEIKDFIGMQLRGNTRVKIEAGSYRPRSLAAKQEMLMEMFSIGLLPSVMFDPEHYRQFMEVMGVEGFETSQSLDYKAAKMENELLKKPDRWMEVERQAGDDDLVHLTVHTLARKKPNWKDQPMSVQQRHLQHEIQHLEAIVEAEGMPDLSLSGAEEVDELSGGEMGAEEGGGQEPSGGGSNGKKRPGKSKPDSVGGNDARPN
jgi:hypothetical protein